MRLASVITAPLALIVLVSSAFAQQAVMREQDIGELRLGQRVLVDDGSCPTGQVKEVLGSQMTTEGVVRSRKCVPRLGPKRR